MAVWFVFHIAKRQDRKSLDQTTEFVRLLLKEKEKRLEQSLVTYADWDAAYTHLLLKVDVDWAYNQDNFGHNLENDLSVEYAAVFDPKGDEVYSVANGRLMTEPMLSKLGGVRELVDRARQMGPRQVVTGLLIADGAPVFASASILSVGADTSVKTEPGIPSVVLFGDRVPNNELAALRDSLKLEKLRLIKADPGALPADSFLRTSDGSVGFALEVPARK